ncbi:hypothetical protein [Vibrio parahaemolyticus]|uniref:hypothetical protein n=1 Tax=Vibrio parahaemolyticus TaxID=670 RepID=UPI00111EC9B7|nr:hypothetical protein [Vibrio parahaemolyticus]TOM96828.1 hypothetical protein CGH65_20750 [Vibrio parahaemolyticus]
MDLIESNDKVIESNKELANAIDRRTELERKLNKQTKIVDYCLNRKPTEKPETEKREPVKTEPVKPESKMIRQRWKEHESSLTKRLVGGFSSYVTDKVESLVEQIPVASQAVDAAKFVVESVKETKFKKQPTAQQQPQPMPTHKFERVSNTHTDSSEKKIIKERESKKVMLENRDRLETRQFRNETIKHNKTMNTKLTPVFGLAKTISTLFGFVKKFMLFFSAKAIGLISGAVGIGLLIKKFIDTGLPDFLSNFVNGAKDFVTSLKDRFSDFIDGLLSNIKEGISSIVADVKSAVGAPVEIIKDGVSNTKEFVVNGLESAGENISKLYNNVTDSISSKFERVFTNERDKTHSGISSVIKETAASYAPYMGSTPKSEPISTVSQSNSQRFEAETAMSQSREIQTHQISARHAEKNERISELTTATTPVLNNLASQIVSNSYNTTNNYSDGFAFAGESDGFNYGAQPSR